MLKAHYNTLGVNEGASTKEIREAFRRLAPLYHPDVNHKPDSEERFKDISEAFYVLKDEERRAKYNQLLRYRNTIDDVFHPTGGTYNNGFTREDLGNMFRHEFGEEIFNRNFRHSHCNSEYNKRKNDKEALRGFVGIFCMGLVLGALSNEYVTNFDIYPINEFIKPAAMHFGGLWAGTATGGFTGGIIGFLYQGYRKLDFAFKASKI